MSSLKLDLRRDGEIPVVTLAGRLDGNSAPEFGALLKNDVGADCAVLILDLADLRFISSAGLRELTLLVKRLAPHKGRAILVAVPPMIDEVLDMSGLSAFFQRAESVEAAAKQLRAGGKGGNWLKRMFKGV